MSPELEFRPDLYRGTAAYYDRYRPPYPGALVEDLRRRLPISGGGRLLDLACGTGQIAFPLSEHFAHVVAVDQEEEFIACGRAKSEALRNTKIEWVAGSAEVVAVDGPFELVAVGNAFHRLNRQTVAARMLSWLEPGGAVALLWSDSPSSGDRPWQRALADLLREWTTRAGLTDRVPAGWEAAMEGDPHEQVVRRAGFEYVGKYEFVTDQIWTVKTLTGLVYSSSVLNRRALGDKVTEFEQRLAERLIANEPDGEFHEAASYAYELARKPRSD